jgi:hypothetical protein
MKKSRFTDSQIIAVLKQAEVGIDYISLRDSATPVISHPLHALHNLGFVTRNGSAAHELLPHGLDGHRGHTKDDDVLIQFV